MVFGTFDSIHPGHLNFFKQAKQYGDYLIVVVALDLTVNEVKGHLPKKSQEQRRKDVESVKSVDRAVFGNPDDKHKVVIQNSPDVICLGYDQEAFTQNLEKKFPEIKFVRLQAYNPETFKSSKL